MGSGITFYSLRWSWHSSVLTGWTLPVRRLCSQAPCEACSSWALCSPENDLWPLNPASELWGILCKVCAWIVSAVSWGRRSLSHGAVVRSRNSIYERCPAFSSGSCYCLLLRICTLGMFSMNFVCILILIKKMPDSLSKELYTLFGMHYAYICVYIVWDSFALVA